jgi:hypothetical protein
MTLNLKYFKRVHSQTITRLKKDWKSWEWYYFEVGDDDYAVKQLQKDHLGKVLKYDSNKLDDEYGGLAEGALDLAEEQYVSIKKDEFYALWNTIYTNQYVIRNLIFNDDWNFSWYNLNLNTTENDLKKQELIICGTHRNLFTMELGFNTDSDFFFLQINKDDELLIYTTTTEWAEMANVAQVWIDKLQKV